MFNDPVLTLPASLSVSYPSRLPPLSNRAALTTEVISDKALRLTRPDTELVGKHGADLVSSPTMCSTAVSATSPGNVSIHSTIDPLLQVHQLEQNVRFLKEQHQIMLSALHQEIEALRNRNRDMQFQLVFTRNEAKRSPQPAEEAPKSEEVLSSPQPQSPSPSARVESLERKVAELKTSLGEAKTKNVKLQEIIDEQQRRLSELTIKAERNQPSDRERSLANQLQETVQLVHRMRRFHEEQRRELAALKGEKFRAQQAAEVVGEQVRAVKHHQGGGLPPQPQILQPPPQILQPSQQPRSIAQTKSLHHHHHQAHHKIQQQQQQQHKQHRHEQQFFSRELPPEGGSQNNRFPALPAVQNYWQSNGHSRWASGIENNQRPPASRPIQSMPSLPAINSGTPNSGRRTHYFRGGSFHQESADGSRKFRGKGSGGRINRNHDE